MKALKNFMREILIALFVLAVVAGGMSAIYQAGMAVIDVFNLRG